MKKSLSKNSPQEATEPPNEVILQAAGQEPVVIRLNELTEDEIWERIMDGISSHKPSTTLPGLEKPATSGDHTTMEETMDSISKNEPLGKNETAVEPDSTTEEKASQEQNSMAESLEMVEDK